MQALALLLALRAAAPAVVAESFPDDDTGGWALRVDVYAERYDDGSSALMVEVFAAPPDGAAEYALQVYPDRTGRLTACEGYTRPPGAPRWEPLFSDPACESGERYPWREPPPGDE